MIGRHPKLKSSFLTLVIVSLMAFSQTGCGAKRTQMIAGGMAVGAAVGAGVGYQFVHHGERMQHETRNTIVTSAVFALVAGGLLAWHYRELEETKVEISGRYARYRLCDPAEMELELARQLEMAGETTGEVFGLTDTQIGNLALSLDDNTKWVYPTFRKRYLQPERGENQVISERYIWEIVKPGRFVTRSQNPRFFLEMGPTETGVIEDDEVLEP